MIASSTGAFLTSLTMTPLDVIKIRLQAQATPTAFSKGNCFLYCNGLMDHLCPCVNGLSESRKWYKRQGVMQFSGTFDAMIKIARHEGVTSLWSGLPPTLVMAIPATVVYFTCYEQLRCYLCYRPNVASDQWKPLVSGALARIWAATLISPVEMVRTKIQSENLSYTAVFTAVRRLVRQQGLLSLWRGLGPTLLRDVPFSGLYWGGYETIKNLILHRTQQENLLFHQTFFVGATSGSIAAVITLPFDVIKTRRQIELGLNEGASSSTWKTIHKMYTEEGVRSLYTGLLPRLMKVAPACAIMISTYEFFKNYFISHNSPADQVPNTHCSLSTPTLVQHKAEDNDPLPISKT